KHVFNYPNLETAEVSFSLQIVDGPADTFEWDFGDGTKFVKKEPVVQHTYQREFDDAKAFQVKVTAKGPGDCVSSTDFPIKIPGRPHPALTEVNDVEQIPLGDGSKVRVEFEAKLADNNNPHESYVWIFGDGTEITTAGLTASHDYHLGSKALEFTVSVQGIGPEDCESQVKTSISFDSIKKPCPVINSITKEGPKDIGGDKVQVDLKANISGGTPNRFVWHWIDQGQEFTTATAEPRLSTAFDKAQKERSVRINLHTQGPSDCKGNADISLVIPEKGAVGECPWYLKALPYAMALFLTMLICAVITCYAGVSLGKLKGDGAPQDHLYTWTIVMAFLSIIGGFVWGVVGRKRPCGPTKCNLSLAAMTALIGSGIFAAFIADCLGGATLMTSIFLILGIAGVIYYNRNCKRKHSMGQLALFVVIGVIGVVLAISMHAGVSLDCTI
ncbi:MAG: PKD domain-containing protein, partial [Bacteroidota bacterium]